MPVEITLPLNKFEQAVADARENEKQCAAVVEDQKLKLKTAKAAWEESVEELKTAVDEMIRAKRQPSLFSDGDHDDDKPADAAGDAPADPTPGGPAGEPVTTEVVILSPKPRGQADEGVTDYAAELFALPAGPKWRSLAVTEHIEPKPHVREALDAAGIVTLGELADALRACCTFGLKLVEVDELQEVIENVSADDPEPILFDRTGDTEELLEEPEPEPEPEPVSNGSGKAKRGGRKKKATAGGVGEQLSIDDL